LLFDLDGVLVGGAPFFESETRPGAVLDSIPALPLVGKRSCAACRAAVTPVLRTNPVRRRY
jgi:hypothetical protein